MAKVFGNLKQLVNLAKVIQSLEVFLFIRFLEGVLDKRTSPFGPDSRPLSHNESLNTS